MRPDPAAPTPAGSRAGPRPAGLSLLSLFSLPSLLIPRPGTERACAGCASRYGRRFFVSIVCRTFAADLCQRYCDCS